MYAFTLTHVHVCYVWFYLVLFVASVLYACYVAIPCATCGLAVNSDVVCATLLQYYSEYTQHMYNVLDNKLIPCAA